MRPRPPSLASSGDMSTPLNLLASWTATLDQAETAQTTDKA
jgi:hypothetical protein